MLFVRGGFLVITPSILSRQISLFIKNVNSTHKGRVLGYGNTQSPKKQHNGKGQNGDRRFIMADSLPCKSDPAHKCENEPSCLFSRCRLLFHQHEGAGKFPDDPIGAPAEKKVFQPAFFMSQHDDKINLVLFDKMQDFLIRVPILE